MKRSYIILFIVVLLLLIPLVAMQFTDEIRWSPIDFCIAAILLGGTGLLFEFVMRKIQHNTYRIIILVGLLLVLILIWAELAVGIFGTPFGGQ